MIDAILAEKTPTVLQMINTEQEQRLLFYGLVYLAQRDALNLEAYGRIDEIPGQNRLTLQSFPQVQLLAEELQLKVTQIHSLVPGFSDLQITKVLKHIVYDVEQSINALFDPDQVARLIPEIPLATSTAVPQQVYPMNHKIKQNILNSVYDDDFEEEDYQEQRLDSVDSLQLTKQGRNTQERQDLKQELDMTDEQIEGYGRMRNPARTTAPIIEQNLNSLVEPPQFSSGQRGQSRGRSQRGSAHRGSGRASRGSGRAQRGSGRGRGRGRGHQ